jgi:hypothetical protein
LVAVIGAIVFGIAAIVSARAGKSARDDGK